METPISQHNGEAFVVELKQCANLLVSKLQNDDFEDASALIHSLVEVRDRHIFNSVGQLTRALHNAIVNFNVDASVHGKSDMVPSQIRDASDRLQYVISMTQEAAEKTMRRTEGIINSMTPTERLKPDLIKASRKRRIAEGAGLQVQEVNKVLKQYEQMRDMMKKFQGGGMAKMMKMI